MNNQTYQMTIEDILAGETLPHKVVLHNGTIIRYDCKLCGMWIGWYDTEANEWIEKRKCPNGHRVKGFNE